MTSSLGIAITTFNSCDLVVRQVNELRRLTHTDYELVVTDDGSNDGTVDALRDSGVNVVTGANRGVAWNKNRGLFYLLNKTNCRVILLLDDDILPVVPGWESDWIEAAERFGHVNYMIPGLAATYVLAGDMTAASPGLATSCFGPLIGFTREACAYVGYFDVRFGRWGFEHADFTQRFARLGYGGVPPGQNRRREQLYVVLSSGVNLLDRVSPVTAEDRIPLIESGSKILAQSQGEPTYRCPWRDDKEMLSLKAEMSGDSGQPLEAEFSSLSIFFDGVEAGVRPGITHARAETNERLPDAPSQTLFMIHIPKTGGKTVNHLLTEMLSNEQVLINVEERPDFLANMQSIPPEVRYVSGHCRLPDVLANVNRPKWFIFANLRNPVEQLLSHLKMVKSLGAPGVDPFRNQRSGIIQEMADRLWEISLNDIERIHRFIYEEFNEAKQYFDNCQVRYLIDYRDRLIGSADASEAVGFLSHLDYVGFTEDLSGTFSELTRALQANVGSVPIPHTNRSLSDERVDLSDPAIRDFYREAVRWDAFLYTAAQK
jgi:Glycosyl transferase family 2